MKFFKRTQAFIETYKRPRRILGSVIVLVLSLVVGVLAGYQTFGVALKERALDKEINWLQRRIAKFSEDNAGIQDEIRRAHSEVEVERRAKAELGLQKPDEKVAVVILSASGTPSEAPQAKTFWEKLGSILLFWR